MKEYSKYLCDRDCNTCEAIQNKQVALLLNVLALVYGEGIWWITNKVCANLTCCPDCNIDDFCHDTTGESDGFCACIDKQPPPEYACTIANKAIELANEFKDANESIKLREVLRGLFDNGLVPNPKNFVVCPPCIFEGGYSPKNELCQICKSETKKKCIALYNAVMILKDTPKKDA